MGETTTHLILALTVLAKVSSGITVMYVTRLMHQIHKRFSE